VNTADLLETNNENIPAITQKLDLLERQIIGVNTKAAVDSKEVTILADKTIPFNVLKKIMTTCTGSGFGRISLAVIQKASQT
jgi:biopolymer transport protein ExbD